MRINRKGMPMVLQVFNDLEKLQRINLNAEDVLYCEGTLEEHAQAAKQLHYGEQRLQQTCRKIDVFIGNNQWGQA